MDVPQKVNAPTHTARNMKSWIGKQNVQLFKWTPYSPDFNIIWTILGVGWPDKYTKGEGSSPKAMTKCMERLQLELHKICVQNDP